MTWFHRDPENDLLVGPDDCHCANEHQTAHYALLKLCGCGHPEEAYNFLRDVLVCFDRRKTAEEWIDAEEAAAEIIRKRPEEEAHALAHLLTNLDVLEHGGSVGGSWLTEGGKRIVDMGPVTDELDQDA